MNNTCQICERVIKANTGVIAHHGYQRPDRGSGWQTPSCWGARHLPYEKSCDQIQPCIDHIKLYIDNQKTLLNNLMTNPPEVIKDIPWIGAKERVYARPEGFDAVKNEERGSHKYLSYEHEHHARVKFHKNSIRTSMQDILRLTKRLEEWKPQI